jgi:hypothetical protein
MLQCASHYRNDHANWLRTPQLQKSLRILPIELCGAPSSSAVRVLAGEQLQHCEHRALRKSAVTLQIGSVFRGMTVAQFHRISMG